jgi:hypothetical protein
MPACFSLRKKDVKELSRFADIDDEMCAAFGIPSDEKKYYMGWYDYIGFKLAVGQSFADIIRQLESDVAEYPEEQFSKDMLAIALWLDKYYTSDAWYDRSARR